MFNTKLRLAVAACAVAATTANIAHADDAVAGTSTGVRISPVVVTATRTGQNSFDLPVAIDLVEQDKIQDAQLQMTLSESLIRVPGVTAQNRNQLAQDPQISTRGFGARSQFGVRGIRVYVDGIPLSMPDGIGQPGVVDLSTIKGIEVMRGPFSALYGSSSGGVVNMLTEDAPKDLTITGKGMFGSYGTQRELLKAGGTQRNLEYQVETSHFESDGYRQHSSSRKDQATAKLKLHVNEDTQLSMLVNWFEQPIAEDPLGIDRPSAFTNPRSVVAAAINSNTRVERDHTQAGFNLEHRINSENSINLVTYLGERRNLQYLPTNTTGTTGRASQINRDFWGMDMNWANTGNLLERPYKITIGTVYGRMNDFRTDINATGGIANGSLNRFEKNIAWNFDEYGQAQWSVLSNVDLHAGVRRTKVGMEVKNYLSTVSGSGSVLYQKTTPVTGIVWKVTPAFNLYANYGEGFENPTFVEVAYTTTAGAGPNLSLKPSTSRNYEVGAKAFLNDSTRVNLTLFKILTDSEIVVDQNANGRSTYINAGKTYRDGAEMSLESALPYDFSVYAACTFLNAKFDSAFTTTTSKVNAGNRIPATYRTQVYGEVSWKHSPLGFKTALEAQYNSKVFVNDINTDNAPAYTIFNLRAGFEQSIQNWRLSEFARIENLFDKSYIGSVKVNDSNSRFFEPAPPRNWLLGLNASYHF